MATTRSSGADVITSGLISASVQSFSMYSRDSFTMMSAAWPMCLPLRPSFAATLRAWKGCSPTIGCSGSLMIASGRSCATCSISTPPSRLAIRMFRRLLRSVVIAR